VRPLEIPQPLVITGASGFVGRYAMRALGGIACADDQGDIDIRDRSRLSAFLAKTRASAVLHLAALAFVPESVASERDTHEVNFFGTLNLLQALRDSGFSGRFLFVSSAEVYGQVDPSRLPTTEDVPLAPRNPYAASKVAAEALCQAWSTQASFEIVRARPFNHIGPGQSDRFVVSDFARQVVEIKLGRREPIIRTGDLSPTRDFSDVRDIVDAYGVLLAKGKSGDVYNICSGIETQVRTMLDRLLALSGVSAQIDREAHRERPKQQLRSLGSFQKLHSATGWSPRIPLDQSLRDVLTDWTDRFNG
jgi:GDP-4-dehydro-6-deoxy-D-mannose reductase